MRPKSASFISNNLILNGNIEFQGNIRIDGKVTGKIQCQNIVTVGEEAQIDADIVAKNLFLGVKPIFHFDLNVHFLRLKQSHWFDH